MKKDATGFDDPILIRRSNCRVRRNQQSMKCFLTRTSHSRRVPGPSCCTPSATTATDAAPPVVFTREKWLTDSDHTADPNIEPAVIANMAACRSITRDEIESAERTSAR